MSMFLGCVSNNSRKKVSKEEVYKYTLKDYDDTYAIPLRVLKFLGVRLTRNDSEFVALCWTIFFWFEFGNMMLALCLEVGSMLATAQGGSFDDAVKIFLMMPCVGYVVLAMVKSGKMMCNRPVFENLVRELRGLWPLDALAEEEYLIVKKGLVHVHRAIKGYYYYNNVLLLIFMAPPFIQALKRALMGYDDVELLLPFFYWFPFDPFQSYLYPFVLVVQTWQGTNLLRKAVLLCSDWCGERASSSVITGIGNGIRGVVTLLSMVAGDFLFIVFLSHVSTQLELLAARARRGVRVPVDRQMIAGYPLSLYNQGYEKKGMGVSRNWEDKDWEKRLQLDLTQIILRHQTLIRLAGDVEDMFSFSSLVNFFNSSIIICFCGLCCVLVEKWNDLTYKAYLLSAVSQTWLLCWYGQRLLDSSAGVADALYNNGWYRTSKKTSKTMFIMLHRSQKKVRVTTYGFSTISMETFAKIAKTSWSYFTLLLKFYK